VTRWGKQSDYFKQQRRRDQEQVLPLFCQNFILYFFSRARETGAVSVAEMTFFGARWKTIDSEWPNLVKIYCTSWADLTTHAGRLFF
jgi:hypothetical protein